MNRDSGKSGERMNLFIGNISRDVTEAELRSAFEAFGQVVSLNIVKDKFNGVSYPVQKAAAAIFTPEGKKMLENFLFNICNCKKSWTMKSFARDAIAEIRAQVGKGKVILGLSGGVDSSVAAVLLHRAIGRQLNCVFVDNGVLREGETEKVQAVFRKHFQMNRSWHPF
jgi:GMP synthase (glutamine-hydrolysing)